MIDVQRNRNQGRSLHRELALIERPLALAVVKNLDTSGRAVTAAGCVEGTHESASFLAAAITRPHYAAR